MGPSPSGRSWLRVLGERPNRRLEIVMAVTGRFFGSLCFVPGTFFPMYFAGRLEAQTFRSMSTGRHMPGRSGCSTASTISTRWFVSSANTSSSSVMSCVAIDCWEGRVSPFAGVRYVQRTPRREPTKMNERAPT